MADPQVLIVFEARDPDAPQMFTLEGESFWMDLSAAFLPQPASPDAPSPQPWEQTLEEGAMKFARNMVRAFSGPVHVRDIAFSVSGDVLTVQIWKRVRGLRLAPIVVVLSGITNPEEAARFAALIQERARAAAHPGIYHGLFDYWASWITLVMGILSGFIALGWWISRRSRQS
jgi:hypothetical protein